MHLRVHYIIMWKFIGTILTNSSRDWRYSRPSKAIYFRFKPQFIEDKPPTVLVAQAVRDGNIYIFDKQVIEIPMSFLEIAQLLLEALIPVGLALLERNTKLTRRNLEEVTKLKTEWRENQLTLANAVQRNDDDIKRLIEINTGK